jgi:hypothetical protein
MLLMAHRLYVIEFRNRGWHFRVGPVQHGPFLTRNEAIEAAIALASRRGDASVIVRSPWGEVTTVWPEAGAPDLKDASRSK